MRLLDLFCGAGGAAMGYYRAGFDKIIGIDHNPQPRFPFDFIQADALNPPVDLNEFDLIHASPPCQAYTKATRQWRKEGYQYPDLIAETRRLLKKSDIHYVIENVPDSPLINPIILNGAMFEMLVHRERLFECSFEIPFFLLPQLPKPVKMGRRVKEGDVIQPVGHFIGVQYAREQMGIEWMIGAELSEAIPPAYTEWIGQKFFERNRDV
jgi:DNA (cytosine-5)-methyltransferase 1